jgi:thiamine pyrophosphate-dependent acetolactate synthase large subunit-like protein
VYLTLPREVLAQELESFTYDERPRMRAGVTMPASGAIQEAARALARARYPIAIARSIGRDPTAIAPLVGWRDAQSASSMRSRPHELSGARLWGNDAAPYLEEADTVLVLESDVP